MAGAAGEVAVLGVGMHPWGKWGRNFIEYGVHAARNALADADLDWREVQFVAGGETIRNGYPGFVAGAAIAQALGFNGAQVGSAYGACAAGTQAIATARAHILAGLCDVALVVGAGRIPTPAIPRHLGWMKCWPRRWFRILCGCCRFAPPAMAARHWCCLPWNSRGAGPQSRSPWRRFPR